MPLSAPIKWQVAGPSRPFVLSPDTDAHVGQHVTTRATIQRGASRDSRPVFCRLPDGSPLWVSPFYLRAV